MRSTAQPAPSPPGRSRAASSSACPCVPRPRSSAASSSSVEPCAIVAEELFRASLGASFGAATPFCSCSSIPLFLGFTTARIPIGITMSFLITSPLINEIAVVLLWGLLGWKFTLIYLAVGMGAGILGGFLMDSLKAERWLQPFVIDAMGKSPNAMQHTNGMGKAEKLSVRQRHDFAYAEMISIFKKVWKWVVIGVGIGAALHGFVPDNWFADNLGKV
ncbi:permease [Pseudomonas aeruginosa]|nr:permease [Pseudomonas aeruginosa]